MSIRRIFVLTVAALLAGGTAVSAQSCLGLPSRDGGLAVAGSYGWMDGGDAEVGGEFHADVTGPAAFGFSYRTGTGDAESSTYEFRGSYDLFLLEPAICVVAGIRYMDVDAGPVSERLGVPVGFGIGKTMDTGRFSTTVYAVPQFMWVREVRTDALGAEDTETSNEFVGEAGATLGILPFFINGAIVLNTLDNEPAFRIRAGLMF